MKKIFTKPEIEVTFLDYADVVCASADNLHVDEDSDLEP